MGNNSSIIRDGGRRRHHSTNIPPETETAPPPPPNPLVFSPATPYPNYSDHIYPSPPGAMPAHHPWFAGGRYPMMPPPYSEHQKSVTIRNDVDLNKETLRLEPDPDNPSRLLVSFTFDATVSGRLTVVFFAKEGEGFNLTATKEDTLPPISIDFEKGLGQKFVQPPGTGIDLSVYEDSELFKEAETDTYPLAIKMKAETDTDTPENAQITQVAFVKEEGDIKIRAVKQILWVNRLRYELQDILGVGNTVYGRHEDTSNPGCVECLSEPRDTVVLPCRHMCLCSGCAKVLRFQKNRCPVCSQPVERLMKIHLNSNNNGGNGDGDEET